MKYRLPKRIFEDSGYVDPKKSYHVHIENVVNRHKQNMKTMVDNVPRKLPWAFMLRPFSAKKALFPLEIHPMNIGV